VVARVVINGGFCCWILAQLFFMSPCGATALLGGGLSSRSQDCIYTYVCMYIYIHIKKNMNTGSSGVQNTPTEYETSFPARQAQLR